MNLSKETYKNEEIKTKLTCYTLTYLRTNLTSKGVHFHMNKHIYVKVFIRLHSSNRTLYINSCVEIKTMEQGDFML
jgi:hypothetical protein